MRIAIIGAAALNWVAGCSDDTCTVTEAADGTVQITCSGEPIDIEPCFASLPDLDGSGVVDSDDCALVGVGASQRALCEDSEAWWALPSCRATELATIRTAQDVMDAQSVWWTPFRHVFGTTANLSVWTDSNDDGRYDPSEEHVISAVTGISGVEQIDQLTVVGWGGAYAVVWSDANEDGIPDPAEISELQLVQQGQRLARLAVFHRGSVYALAFQAAASGTPLPTVRAWTDLNADRHVTAAEIIDVSAEDDRLVDTDDRSVHFERGFQRLVWTPPPAIWETGSDVRSATSDESRCVDFVSALGHTFCLESATFGSGVKRIDIGVAEALPLVADALDVFGGNQVVAVRGAQPRPRSTIWEEGDGLGYPDEDELRFVSGRSVFFRLRDRVLSFGPTTDASYAVETWHARDVTRYLGEACGLLERCAANLTCRVSGNATDSRCVPVVAQ